MSMFSAFPKIFALGTDYVREICDGPVEITEKVDGSQFAFGVIDGELVCRSKGKQLVLDAPEKMFSGAVEYAQSISHLLLDGYVFYAEWLQKPKHNMLAYTRVPRNGLALFAVKVSSHTFDSSHASLSTWADALEIDVAPLVFEGKTDHSAILEMLDRESFLGGPKIEGVVVKNYAKPYLIGGHSVPVMSAKYVSESFKEVHREGWGKEHTSRGRFEDFKEGFRTEARWEKAVQHLREAGQIAGEPRDIGALIKEVQRDIREEESEAIKAFLWGEFGKEILRKSVAGLPGWYKRRLVEHSAPQEDAA